MAAALKDIYSIDFFDFFIHRFSSIYPINPKDFKEKIYVSSWEKMALKQRMNHVASRLHSCIPESYDTQISILLRFVDSISDVQNSDWMLAYMFIPDFIEQFGLQEYECSIKAIEKITQFTSCEFVIRKFIEKYPDATIQQMYTWSKHSNANVRRLSCEGLRLYLPWGIRVKYLIDNFQLILPVLEQLKNDESLFVRKSVANSLNDLSKLNPTHVILICKKWKNAPANTDWIIKHGVRTLLKNGNKDALELLGISTSNNFSISDFIITQANANLKDSLQWTCAITNNSNSDELIRVEYVLYLLRKNGKYSKKVFYIHQKIYNSHEKVTITKAHSFKSITTRKYYGGMQFISMQINGIESHKLEFIYQE